MSSNRVRVLHTLAALKTGGINSLLLRNLRHMNDPRLKHHVCVLGRVDAAYAKEYAKLGIEPIPLDHKGWHSGLRTFRRLLSLLKEEDIDVVHAHFPLDGAYVALASSLLRIPFIFSLHSDRISAVKRGHLEVPNWKQTLRARVADRLIFTSADCIVAVSRTTGRGSIKWRGAPPEKVKTIYNGIDVHEFTPSTPCDERSLSLRSDLQIPEDAPVLLNVGRLTPQKGQALLISVMRHLQERVPNAVLLIAGDGELRSALESRVEQCRMQEKIRLLGLRHDVSDLMRLADAFVFPSLSEGFGITLLEAMAAEVPVVASDIPPLAEIISNGVNGILASVGNARAFVDKVARILQDPDFASVLGEAARAEVQARFDIRHTAHQTEMLYRQLAGTHHPQA